MIYEMKLDSKYFDFILSEKKRIEIRLNDEKRQVINSGDTITFLRMSDLNQKLNVKVIKKFKYSTFLDLINDFDISLLADKSMTKDELLSDLEKFYSKKKEIKYGVVGILIELC